MSRVTSRISLTVIGKPDCHLCDVAHDIVERVVADLPDSVADRVDVTEASILDEPALYELWWEKVPVVLIDDEVHAHWRVSSDALRTAILSASDRVGARS